MRRIKVRLGDRSYDIVVKPGLLSNGGLGISDIITDRKCLIVSDENVYKIYGTLIAKGLGADAEDVTHIALQPGERSKRLSMVERIYHKALADGLERSSIVVALGGGVPGDIAGFVAATYMRGIGFVQIPTSLLAMVDSSVGGKTGVDMPEGKNLIGSFWQPKAVLIDPEVLATLPPKELRCGLAEVVKYGVIMDAEFFELLENNVGKLLGPDMAVYTKVIARCCELKAEVVSKDERESGLRAILNYGHTFAHAIEKVSGFEGYPHWEAVAVGMNMAARYGVFKGILDKRSADRQEKLLDRLGLPVKAVGLDPESMIEAMSSDKKVRDGVLNFIIPDRIGRVSMNKTADRKTIIKAIKACMV